VHSPKIERIEVAARGDVRRAKLYYLRDRVGRASRVRERRWSGAEEVIQPGLIAEEGAMPADDAPRAGEEELADQTAAEEAAAEDADAPAAEADQAPAEPEPVADDDQQGS
jgi:large subunit ribosomal protein L19